MEPAPAGFGDLDCGCTRSRQARSCTTEMADAVSGFWNECYWSVCLVGVAAWRDVPDTSKARSSSPAMDLFGNPWSHSESRACVAYLLALLCRILLAGNLPTLSTTHLPQDLNDAASSYLLK